MQTAVSEKLKRPTGYFSARRRSLIPTVEQRRNLLEQEFVEVAHLGEPLTGKAAVLGGGDPGFGGFQHR